MEWMKLPFGVTDLNPKPVNDRIKPQKFNSLNDEMDFFLKLSLEEAKDYPDSPIKRVVEWIKDEIKRKKAFSG